MKADAPPRGHDAMVPRPGTAPVFRLDGDDVSCWVTLGDFEGQKDCVQEYDVEDPEVTYVDAGGSRLRLRHVGDGHYTLDPDPTTDPGEDRAELERVLRSHLRWQRAEGPDLFEESDDELAVGPLSELVVLMQEDEAREQALLRRQWERSRLGSTLGRLRRTLRL